MYFPIASRVVATCVGLFLGSSAFAQTPDDCIPNPISPGSCLNVKSMIPGLSDPSDRLDPRADRPTAIREDTSRARLRERQPLAPVIPNPGNVKRPRTSPADRSEEHTSELQSLMRISYAVCCLKKKQQIKFIKHSITATPLPT